MLKLDPENCVIYLFIAVFALLALCPLWPYLLAALVLYAIAQGFCSQRHHSQHGQPEKMPQMQALAQWTSALRSPRASL